MRFSPALPLLAAVFACASAAPAQSSPDSIPLVARTGSLLAYRISFPRGWEVEREEVNASRQAEVQGGRITNTVRVQFEGELLRAESGTRFIQLVVLDAVPVQRSDMPVSWAEQRRIVTNTLLSSDSLLYGVMGSVMRTQGTDFRNVVREIRTLGGQRAGYLSALLVQQNLTSRTELYVTIKDGIVYVLLFAEADSRFAAHEPLFARVRDSLVFAENAPVSTPE